MSRLRESCSTGRTGRRLLQEIQGANTRVLVEVSGGQHNAQPKIKIRVIGSPGTTSITAWFVLEGEKLYLLPVQGSDTEWYRNVLKNPSIRIDARGVGAELRATPVTDGKAVKSVIERFRESAPEDRHTVALLQGALLSASVVILRALSNQIIQPRRIEPRAPPTA